MANTLERLKAEAEYFNYEINGNKISVVVGGFPFQVAEGDHIYFDTLESCKRMYRFFSLEKKMIKEGYSGWYAVVKRDLSVSLVSTEDEAITMFEENPDSFLHRIDSSTELLFEDSDLSFKAKVMQGDICSLSAGVQEIYRVKA